MKKPKHDVKEAVRASAVIGLIPSIYALLFSDVLLGLVLVVLCLHLFIIAGGFDVDGE